MKTKIDVIDLYLKNLTNFETDSEKYKDIFHKDFVQTELPNLLNKNGQKSDLTNIFQRMKMAQTILKSQSYKVVSKVEEGDKLVVEAIWNGTMAIDAGPLKAGQTLKAFFCMVFEFHHNLLMKQTNYDCFEAFG